MLNTTLKELHPNSPVILDNKSCVYCGVQITSETESKEHVIGRRFVPKGKLNGQWNLIVKACKECNGKKSDLENDISAITMQADAWGRHVSEDKFLADEAIRKAQNSISRRTGKPINPNNSLLYLETQNTVVSRLLGMILNNFIVNPLRIMSLGSKGHFFKKILAYELRFCR